MSDGGIMLTIIGGGVLVFALIVALTMWGTSVSCHASWPGRETSWGIMQGCLVKVGNEWWPSDNVRTINGLD